MNINGTAKAAQTYDAIVIGSGISGGWAAKELCEKGLRTLVLEQNTPKERRKSRINAAVEECREWPTKRRDGISESD